MQKFISYPEMRRRIEWARRHIVFVSLAMASSVSYAADGYNLLGVQGGRFVYGWAGGTAKTAALIDTQTGRMWEPICVVADLEAARSTAEQQCLRTVLRPIYFEHEDGLISLSPDGKKFIVKPGDFEDIPQAKKK